MCSVVEHVIYFIRRYKKLNIKAIVNIYIFIEGLVSNLYIIRV